MACKAAVRNDLDLRSFCIPDPGELRSGHIQIDTGALPQGESTSRTVDTHIARPVPDHDVLNMKDLLTAHNSLGRVVVSKGTRP